MAGLYAMFTKAICNASEVEQLLGRLYECLALPLHAGGNQVCRCLTRETMAILGFGIIDKGRGLLLVERAATAHTIFIVVCHIQGFHDVLEVIVPQDFLRFIDFLLLDENRPRLLLQ